MERAKQLMEMVAKYESLIYDTADYIWKNPETGYREWKTSAYMEEHFEALGYTLTKAGNIPGFYADLDTGRPGPKIAILGELDSLIVGNHPDADPETHAVHACGHNAQCAILLGVAAAMKEPGALDGLCGSIRFMAVPAEELIELGFREELRKQGVIRYFGGKVEFISRGYFDGVDMAMMIHSGKLPEGKTLSVSQGCNGCITKNITFKGVASHAGGSPEAGKNALYAATCGLNAVNAIRETFVDSEHIRFHPIITEGGAAVNAIPETAKVESYVRGASFDSIRDYNKKVNLALAGAAASLGCNVELDDHPGYFPLNNDANMTENPDRGHGSSDRARYCDPRLLGDRLHRYGRCFRHHAGHPSPCQRLHRHRTRQGLLCGRQESRLPVSGPVPDRGCLHVPGKRRRQGKKGPR